MLGGRQTFGERRQLGCCEPARADLSPAICEEGRGLPIDLLCVLVVLATVATVVAAVTAVVALGGALTFATLRQNAACDAFIDAIDGRHDAFDARFTARWIHWLLSRRHAEMPTPPRRCCARRPAGWGVVLAAAGGV